MALTAEQQAQADIQIAVENARHASQMEFQAKQAKLEAVRIAQQTLIENRRNQPVDAREVTATDITAYATTLVNYVNS
jgi:hypothetical protein